MRLGACTKTLKTVATLVLVVVVVVAVAVAVAVQS